MALTVKEIGIAPIQRISSLTEMDLYLRARTASKPRRHQDSAVLDVERVDL